MAYSNEQKPGQSSQPRKEQDQPRHGQPGRDPMNPRSTEPNKKGGQDQRGQNNPYKS